MAIKKIVMSDDQRFWGHEFWCDESADISNLPNDAPVSSVAIDISTGDIYAIDSTGKWVKISKGNTL